MWKHVLLQFSSFTKNWWNHFSYICILNDVQVSSNYSRKQAQNLAVTFKVDFEYDYRLILPRQELQNLNKQGHLERVQMILVKEVFINSNYTKKFFSNNSFKLSDFINVWQMFESVSIKMFEFRKFDSIFNTISDINKHFTITFILSFHSLILFQLNLGPIQW